MWWSAETGLTGPPPCQTAPPARSPRRQDDPGRQDPRQNRVAGNPHLKGRAGSARTAPRTTGSPTPERA